MEIVTHYSLGLDPKMATWKPFLHRLILGLFFRVWGLLNFYRMTNVFIDPSVLAFLIPAFVS